jgi:hypothetical protein
MTVTSGNSSERNAPLQYVAEFRSSGGTAWPLLSGIDLTIDQEKTTTRSWYATFHPCAGWLRAGFFAGGLRGDAAASTGTASGLRQVDGRADNLSRRIDAHVNAGAYPPPQGGALHHRLDVIRQEAHDMAAQHGGGLSGDEQRVLNQELDGAAHAIGE